MNIEEEKLKEFVKGQKVIEQQRLHENQLWQELTTKLRVLTQKHGATQAEIDACWRVP